MAADDTDWTDRRGSDPCSSQRKRKFSPPPIKPCRRCSARAAVLFCGINPRLYSAAVGHHFARRATGSGRRSTPPASPRGGSQPSKTGAHRPRLRVTNIVGRATATARSYLRMSSSGREEARGQGPALRARYVAVLGISAYRSAFDRPGAALGPQEQRLGGRGSGSSRTRAVSTRTINCGTWQVCLASCAGPRNGVVTRRRTR